MFKIKDRILLGVVTGIIAGVPGRLLNAWEYEKGYTDFKYGQMAASLFLPAQKTNSSQAKLIGTLTNNINLSITGVIVTYLLSVSGRDNAIIKGLGVSSAAWLGIYGLSSRLGLPVRSEKPLAHLLSFADHVTLGSLCAIIASRLGDDSLFPDSNESEREGLRLIEGEKPVCKKLKYGGAER